MVGNIATDHAVAVAPGNTALTGGVFFCQVIFQIIHSSDACRPERLVGNGQYGVVDGINRISAHRLLYRIAGNIQQAGHTCLFDGFEKKLVFSVIAHFFHHRFYKGTDYSPQFIDHAVNGLMSYIPDRGHIVDVNRQGVFGFAVGQIYVIDVPVGEAVTQGQVISEKGRYADASFV